MTKVKICGITNHKDAMVATQVGADLLGFIFYEPSPRYVTPEVVKSIINEQMSMNRSVPTFVGVFVNESLETVSQILDFCQLDAAQLHGEETPEFVNHFQGRAFKALRPQSRLEMKTLMDKYFPKPSSLSIESRLPALLLDAYHPALYGGTGRITDWTLAANLGRQYPILLAGSLTPDNVVEAIQAVQPWGVDVSSGVEAQKGRKDHEKVQAFVEAVKKLKSETVLR